MNAAPGDGPRGVARGSALRRAARSARAWVQGRGVAPGDRVADRVPSGPLRESEIVVGAVGLVEPSPVYEAVGGRRRGRIGLLGWPPAVHCLVGLDPQVHSPKWPPRTGLPSAPDALARALAGGAERFGVRLVRFAVLANQVHLIVEAPDHRGLSRALRGLAIRLARRVNAELGRKGRLVDDRYHARRLRTPTEVRRAIDYVRHNHRRHLGARARELPRGWVDPCSSDSPALSFALPAPATWLCRTGWRRGLPGRPAP